MNFISFAPFQLRFIQLLVVFGYKVNLLCRVSLICSSPICTVFSVILFLTEWCKDLNAHTVEKKYKSSTWYRNHMETVHFGFVQSQSILGQPICHEEPPAQIPQPAVDLASNVIDEEFSIIEL